MSRRPALLGGWLLGVTTGILLLTLVQGLRRRGEDQDLARYEQVRSYALNTFVREVNEDELLDAALTGMLNSLDPYSRYYPPAEASQLDRRTGGIYKGIGAIFRKIDGRRRVLFTLPDSPARKAKLTVGDGILSINGEDPQELSDEAFRKMLTPDSGEPVTLLLQSLAGAERKVKVNAAALVDPSLRHIRMVSHAPPIAWISVLSFSRETPGELQRALGVLEVKRPLAGLILDLRDNRGGVLSSATAIARMFITEGVIVETRGNDTLEIERAIPDEVTHPNLPIVVLVNRTSASASEVLAAALQDHRRAALVGEGTYGKGVVQTIRRFSPWGARAKVTSAFYYSPSGRNFERTLVSGSTTGIQPDWKVTTTKAERLAIAEYLGSHQPDRQEEALLLAWEEQTNLDLLAPIPTDRALERAKAILSGKSLTEQN